MARKVIIVVDPGIDGAYAVALALYDPGLDVLAVSATAGNISPEQATQNVQILVEHLDPPKWPRLGGALPVKYRMDGTRLHGPGGLGGVNFECASLHHQHPGDKIIIDEVHQNRGEVSLIVLGPLTVVARALDKDPELPRSLQQIVVVGGTWHEPGNAGPVSEFHFACDPEAARQVLRANVPITLLPLDVTRKALFSPTELMEVPRGESRASQLLRKVVPFGISASAQHYGIEGFHLKDVLGVCAVGVPQAIKTKPMTVEVETRGELTSGMSVVDLRPERAAPNVNLAIDVDMKAVRAYMDGAFRHGSRNEA
jgi:inosine-uridine nucleoside N-ribohydrolase